MNGDRVHPALFDAGLQVLIGAVTSREQAEGRQAARVPADAGRARRVASPVGATFWSHATVQELTPESFQGTVSLHDDDGNLLLRVEGLRAKTLEDAAAADGSGRATSCTARSGRRRPAPSADETWCAPACRRGRRRARGGSR